MAVGIWRKATSKLFDLEAKIANQVSVLHTFIAVASLSAVCIDGTPMLHFPTTQLCIGLGSHSLLSVSKASNLSGRGGEAVPAHQHMLCGQSCSLPAVLHLMCVCVGCAVLCSGNTDSSCKAAADSGSYREGVCCAPGAGARRAQQDDGELHT